MSSGRPCEASNLTSQAIRVAEAILNISTFTSLGQEVRGSWPDGKINERGGEKFQDLGRGNSRAIGIYVGAQINLAPKAKLPFSRLSLYEWGRWAA